MDRLIKRLNDHKNLYYFEELNQIKEISKSYVTETNSIVKGYDKQHYYSSKSYDDGKNIIIKIKNLWVKSNRTITCSVKRVNENTVIMYFDPLDYKIIITHIFGRFKEMIEIFKTKLLSIHNLLHKFCFLDISLITDDDFERLENLSNESEIKNKIKIRSSNIKFNSRYYKDLILIGLHAYNPVETKLPIEAVLSRIDYNLFDFAKNFSIRNKLRYKIIKGEFDLTGNYVNFYDVDNTLKYRIYDGYGYCYPYEKTSTGLKIGTKILCVKYLILRHLMVDDFLSKKEILFLIKQNLMQQLFNKCHKSNVHVPRNSISSYRRYYKRNWSKRPQRFQLILS